MRPGEGKRKGENVAVAQCPASCGELIQGWILGSEKLVSCPVDWYSTVEVETGKPRNDERPLSRAMVERAVDSSRFFSIYSIDFLSSARAAVI